MKPKRKPWPFLPGLEPAPEPPSIADTTSKAVWALVKRHKAAEIGKDEATVDLYELAPSPGEWGEHCTLLRVAIYKEPRPCDPDGTPWLGDLSGHGPGPHWAGISCCFVATSMHTPDTLRIETKPGRPIDFKIRARFSTTTRKGAPDVQETAVA